MSSTVFRGQQEHVDIEAPEAEMKESSGDSVSEIKIEPPFTDYEKAHDYPFTVEYYDLGKYWQTDDIYSKEVTTIEGYLRAKIESGEYDNSLEAIKEAIKKIEKTAGVEKTDSTVVRVGKVAAYAEFLSKVTHLRGSAQHYANS
jgi:Arc/MetJ-type ribon-helix-helix transcriptional regulator